MRNGGQQISARISNIVGGGGGGMGWNVELVASLLVATLLPNTGHMVDYPNKVFVQQNDSSRSISLLETF